MWKKFLAVIAIVGLFSTSTASALEVGGQPGGAGVVSYIDNFAVAPATFNTSAGEKAVVSFKLSLDADLYVYAIKGNDVYEIAGSAVAPVATVAGDITYQWFGKNPNDTSGQALADGVYTVKAFAYETGTFNIKDSDFSTVELISTPVVDPATPKISGLKVDPLTFTAQGGETTEISFDVNKDACLDVKVKDGATVKRTFTKYDGDCFLDNGSHTIPWDGKDNAGAIVAAGEYTVAVTATSGDGLLSSTETTTVTVTTVGPSSAGSIKDLTLNPSSTWDPTEDSLEIEFELLADVKNLVVTAYKGEGSSPIEILDDNGADADDYEEEWDGTDDDGDFVKEGTWTIEVKAIGDTEISVVTRTIKVEYEKPQITDAFVTKTEIDPSEGEFTNVVFKVDAEAEVTVELYNGNKREATLWDEVEVKKNRWYSVEWDGMDDGEEADEGNWEFRITAENGVDNDIQDKAEVSVEVKEDDVSSNKTNATNDYTQPVVFDEDDEDNMTVSYCLDGYADVFLAVYKGSSTSGKAEIELLDYVEQSSGCHSVQWNGKDDDNKDLKDGVYSYKLISRASGNHKDTETGKFAVGNSGDVDGPVEPPVASTECNDGFDNDGDGYADYWGTPYYAYDPGCDSPEDDDEFNFIIEPPQPPPVDNCGGYWDAGYLGSSNKEMCGAIEWVTNEGIFKGYADGSFGVNNTINRAEVLKVVLEAFPGAVILPGDGFNQGFWDVDTDSWYMPYVRTAKFYGMLHGYPDGSARLGNNINRVEFLKFVLEASEEFTGYNIPVSYMSYYADVDTNKADQAWFKDYAGVSYNYMLFDERYDGGKYYLDPAKMVTRGEVALLLKRMNDNGLLDDYYYWEGDYDYYEVPMWY